MIKKKSKMWILVTELQCVSHLKNGYPSSGSTFLPHPWQIITSSLMFSETFYNTAYYLVPHDLFFWCLTSWADHEQIEGRDHPFSRHWPQVAPQLKIFMDSQSHCFEPVGVKPNYPHVGAY